MSKSGSPATSSVIAAWIKVAAIGKSVLVIERGYSTTSPLPLSVPSFTW
jgi:hypothetical protein